MESESVIQPLGSGGGEVERAIHASVPEPKSPQGKLRR